MNKMMKTLKNKKGFTLVEILVVLIILAILAAVSIPAMLGFVNDAKGKALIAEARSAYVAAQMVATEEMAKGTVDTSIPALINDDAGAADGVHTKRMGELLGTDADGKISGTVLDGEGKVTAITYTKNAKEVTITPGNTSSVKDVT